MKSDSSPQAGVSEKRRFLNLLRKVSSFSNMTAQLKEVVHWCRSCKFHQERKRLSYLLLKCLRMESLEADGIRYSKILFINCSQICVCLHKFTILSLYNVCILSLKNTYQSKIKHRAFKIEYTVINNKFPGCRKLMNVEEFETNLLTNIFK